MNNKISQKNRAKRQRIATLFGIPILLFASGVTLLCLAFSDNIAHAFYFSRMFFPQEVAVAQTNLSNHNEVGEEAAKATQLSFPKYGDEYGAWMQQELSRRFSSVTMQRNCRMGPANITVPCSRVTLATP